VTKKSAAAKKATSSTPSAMSKHGSKSTRTAWDFLRPLLPTGWATYFDARRAGRYWGLSMRCPLCGERPPAELHYGHRKWRWLTVHVSSHHKPRLRKV